MSAHSLVIPASLMSPWARRRKVVVVPEKAQHVKSPSWDASFVPTWEDESPGRKKPITNLSVSLFPYYRQ